MSRLFKACFFLKKTEQMFMCISCSPAQRCSIYCCKRTLFSTVYSTLMSSNRRDSSKYALKLRGEMGNAKNNEPLVHLIKQNLESEGVGELC